VVERVDLRQLDFALAVAEEGGFTAAARRLHTVQSTVSSMVSALEKDLGVTLFERTTRQVRLTEAGEAFVPAARRALAAAREVRTAARSTAPGLHGTIAVGTMQGLWPGLRRALLVMSEEHPNVIVELHQAPAAVVQEEVRNGTLDLAVVALAPQQEQGLATRLLWQEPMVLVTGRTDPLVGDDPVSLSAVGSRPFVDFPDGWAVRHEVDRAFRAAQASRGRRFEVNDLLSAADLVEYNLAVTILPGSLAQRFPRLLARPIESHVPHWSVMLVHRRGEPSEPVRTFLNLLR
jgi:DNA-binding transcriptional LysR family regulator